LAVTAAAIVAAERDIDAGLQCGMHWRHSALQLEIADGIVRDAGPMLGRQRDLARHQPDTMSDRGSRHRQPYFGEIPNHRAPMIAINRTGLSRLRLRLVDMGEDRQRAPRREVADVTPSSRVREERCGSDGLKPQLKRAGRGVIVSRRRASVMLYER